MALNIYSLLHISVTSLYDEIQTQEVSLTLVGEYQVHHGYIEDNITQFLDSHIYDRDNTRVLILCHLSCIKEILFQV